EAEKNRGRAEKFFVAAIASIDLEQPSVEACQALVALVWFCTHLVVHRFSQAWILAGMAFRMVPLLKLDVDPDELGCPKMTWLEKEVRRRTFYAIICMDQLDFVFREKSFGIWKRPHQVNLMAPSILWLSVDPITEEPTNLPIGRADVDMGLLTIQIGNIMCGIAELNLTRGTTYVGPRGPLGLTPTEQNELIIRMAAQNIHSMSSPLPIMNEPTPDEEAKFAYLDGEITAWLSSFPPGVHPGSIATAVQFSTPLPPLNKELPPYLAIKFHLFYFSSRMSLHRPRMITELLKVVRDPIALNKNGVNNDLRGDIGKAWSDAGRESFRRCRESALGITQILVRRIQVLPPSPLPQGPPRPVFTFVGVPESRAILEAGLHHFIMAMIFSIGLPSNSGVMGEFSNKFELLHTSRAVMKMIIEELGGSASAGNEVLMSQRVVELREEALEGLAVVMAVLGDITQRKASGKPVSDQLERMVAESGLDVSGQIKQLMDGISDIRRVHGIDSDHSHLLC
ncbi:hypothetical protein HDU67_003866, partial [Dinochytrium kinnereticum]